MTTVQRIFQGVLWSYVITGKGWCGCNGLPIRCIFLWRSRKNYWLDDQLKGATLHPCVSNSFSKDIISSRFLFVATKFIPRSLQIFRSVSALSKSNGKGIIYMPIYVDTTHDSPFVSKLKEPVIPWFVTCNFFFLSYYLLDSSQFTLRSSGEGQVIIYRPLSTRTKPIYTIFVIQSVFTVIAISEIDHTILKILWLSSKGEMYQRKGSQSTSNTVPRCTLPQPDRIFVNLKQRIENEKKWNAPTNRQCFSILLDSATFSPTSVQAGDVNWIFASDESDLTLITLPPVEVEPMLMSNNSFLTSFVTFVCFLSSVLTPSKRRRRNSEISSSKIEKLGSGSPQKVW